MLVFRLKAKAEARLYESGESLFFRIVHDENSKYTLTYFILVKVRGLQVPRLFLETAECARAGGLDSTVC